MPFKKKMQHDQNTCNNAVKILNTQLFIWKAVRLAKCQLWKELLYWEVEVGPFALVVPQIQVLARPRVGPFALVVPQIQVLASQSIHPILFLLWIVRGDRYSGTEKKFEIQIRPYLESLMELHIKVAKVIVRIHPVQTVENVLIFSWKKITSSYSNFQVVPNFTKCVMHQIHLSHKAH